MKIKNNDFNIFNQIRSNKSRLTLARFLKEYNSNKNKSENSRIYFQGKSSFYQNRLLFFISGLEKIKCFFLENHLY